MPKFGDTPETREWQKAVTLAANNFKRCIKADATELGALDGPTYRTTSLAVALPAGYFNTEGESIEMWAGGTFSNSAGADKRIAPAPGGVEVPLTQAGWAGATGFWHLTGNVLYVGGNLVSIFSVITSYGTTDCSTTVAAYVSTSAYPISLKIWAGVGGGDDAVVYKGGAMFACGRAVKPPEVSLHFL